MVLDDLFNKQIPSKCALNAHEPFCVCQPAKRFQFDKIASPIPKGKGTMENATKRSAKCWFDKFPNRQCKEENFNMHKV